LSANATALLGLLPGSNSKALPINSIDSSESPNFIAASISRTLTAKSHDASGSNSDTLFPVIISIVTFARL
jgi:hypothetical protein